MSDYKPTIGLEIHAELKTLTKMFCNSANDPDLPRGKAGERRPNVNICPVCTAQPGTLPVINKKAVEHVLRVGKAVGGKLADYSEFDRKNYFYPDIPKGYQISQYKYPLVEGGELAGVKLTRIHLEEDTATSKHQDKHSLIDFNRAGVPLMELVTEPVIHSAEDIEKFARELQLLLRYLNVSDANIEKGQMRVEVNVSLSRSSTLGVKVEVKNIGSINAAMRAARYEINRQIKELNSGGKIIQETRGWDEGAQQTFCQRIKEESHDYRYFPEPDLPKIVISEIKEFQNLELPELPAEKRERYRKDFGIKDEDIESYITDQSLGQFFEEVVSELGSDKSVVKLASNYITSDLLGLRKNNESKLCDVKSFALVVKMASSGEISSRGAKELIRRIYIDGGDPALLAEELGLLQQSDEGELQSLVDKVISDNKEAAEEYKNGKEASLQFLVGQGMKESGGSANPALLVKLFKKALS